MLFDCDKGYYDKYIVHVLHMNLLPKWVLSCLKRDLLSCSEFSQFAANYQKIYQIVHSK